MHSSDVVFGGALAFMFGIAIASLGWNVPLLFGGIIGFGLILLIVFRRFDLWKILIAFAAAVFLGAFYYNFYLNVCEADRKIVFNEKITFTGVVANEPRGFEKYKTFNLRLQEPLSGEIRVLTSPLKEVYYGDWLELKGVVEQPASRVEEPAAFFPEITTIGTGQGFWLKNKLLGLKQFLLAQFDKALPADESALLGGITFGSRSDFSESLRQAMSLSGTTHLVALSGYNITVLVLAIGYVFGQFLSRRKTFYLTLLTIGLFVLMVGGEPSVIRAAIMGFLVLLAKEVGRIYNMRNAIALTACAMLIFDPTLLVHNVGFQLSFVSLLGLAYVAPALKSAFKTRDEGFLSLKENIFMTISAQLAVLPIIIGTFGDFSLTAILANVLVLGFIPLTMFFGFLLAALSAIYFYLGFAVAKIAGLLLSYEIWIMRIFADLRLPIEFPASSYFLFALIYYAGLVAFIYRFSYRNQKR